MIDKTQPRPCGSGRHMFTGHRCRECQYERHVIWNKAHPEVAGRWKRNNPERRRETERERMRKFRATPEGRAQVKKDNSTEASRRRKERWRVANPEKVAMKEHRRRARKAAAVADLTEAQWDAILAWHSSPEGTRCAYCFGVCEKVSIDHVVPIAQGGGHTASNIVPACLPCNWSKHAKDVRRWCFE